jgi:hypothetical protein
VNAELIDRAEFGIMCGPDKLGAIIWSGKKRRSRSRTGPEGRGKACRAEVEDHRVARRSANLLSSSFSACRATFSRLYPGLDLGVHHQYIKESAQPLELTQNFNAFK